MARTFAAKQKQPLGAAPGGPANAGIAVRGMRDRVFSDRGRQGRGSQPEAPPAPAPPAATAPVPTDGATAPAPAPQQPTDRRRDRGSPFSGIQDRIEDYRQNRPPRTPAPGGGGATGGTADGGTGGVGGGQPPPAAPTGIAPMTVSDRLNEILKSDSPLMLRAAQQGRNNLNARGLLNSTMAEEAAQAAMIDRALPIAQQESDIAAQMERLKQAGVQEIDRIREAAKFEKDLQKTAGQQQKELKELEGEISKKLQEQQDAAHMERLGAQFAHDLTASQQQHAQTLEQIKLQGDQQFRDTMARAQASIQELSLQIAAGERDTVAKLATQIFGYEQDLRAQLLANPNIPASERAAYEKAIKSLGDPVRAYLDGLYSSPLAPAVPTGIAPAPAAPAPATPAPATPAPAVPPTGIAPAAPDPSTLKGIAKLAYDRQQQGKKLSLNQQRALAEAGFAV